MCQMRKSCTSGTLDIRKPYMFMGRFNHIRFISYHNQDNEFISIFICNKCGIWRLLNRMTKERKIKIHHVYRRRKLKVSLYTMTCSDEQQNPPKLEQLHWEISQSMLQLTNLNAVGLRLFLFCPVERRKSHIGPIF